VKRKEYKAHVDRIFELKFTQRQTMSLINHLNEVVHQGYYVAGITEDGVIILDMLWDSKLKKDKVKAAIIKAEKKKKKE
jgi:hypothetical protein